MSLDFATMDSKQHAHIPYVVILVRALEDWKKAVSWHLLRKHTSYVLQQQHNGQPPKTSAEKQEFKKGILAMKNKQDEENFDEAESQAYRAWTESIVCTLFALIKPSDAIHRSHPTSAPSSEASQHHLLITVTPRSTAS